MKHWRINLILIIVMLFGAAIICRLCYLQVYKHDFYKAFAQGQQKTFTEKQGERGEIFLQNKKGELYPLAINKNGDEGIKRYYPQKFLAAQIVGFFGGEDKGQYGVEGYYDEILTGEIKFQEGERNPWINFFSSEKTQPQKGADLVLTIDYNIQFKAEQLLKQAKENLNIEGGEIIVMDPMSGKIFAMANFPDFDPNEYASQENFEVFKNSAIQEAFEPGSIFKPITMAVALDQNKITPQTTYIDNGFVEISGHTIFNYDKRIWNKITMTEVLEKSINTGAIFAESQIGHKIFLDYVERFGFFERTGIDLQGEVFSQNKILQKGRSINCATASYGQGIEITPIQIMAAYSAIANGGKLVQPYIIESRGNKDAKNDNVISSKSASQTTAMLCSVVQNGFSKQARVPGYYIAGKTGTGLMPWTSLDISKEGYSDKTWQSFIGFAPAFDPEFLILVKLDNPETKTAEYSAVPVFKELAKYIIDYWEIPTDYEM
jgi:cell division protein FtsI (penicillin-binding protein 3)/stage V sporulation protein D (sporulation-specific penicillin-binding protein)